MVKSGFRMQEGDVCRGERYGVDDGGDRVWAGPRHRMGSLRSTSAIFSKERYDHARSDVARTHPRPPVTGAKERREERERRKRVELGETPKQGLAMQHPETIEVPPLLGQQAEVHVGRRASQS